MASAKVYSKRGGEQTTRQGVEGARGCRGFSCSMRVAEMAAGLGRR